MNGTGAIVVIIIIIAFVAGGVSYTYLTQDTVTLTVKDKGIYSDVQCDDHGNCSTRVDHLIYTDKETLENNDEFLYLKFGSSEMYGNIQKGHTYKFKVYGWRIQILGMYRNIISCSEV